ncbi:hypothetical protein [Rhodoferax sediminis]|uniref:Uncharacterized protein n=1 Tax=Rhodoferax sediminis TaxID=2509614 RepID=A0A515DE82_9BURK|nr:hypothetical protein [Rhodoferax sediminis]QDL38732.1 hypothetical protein EUB48_16625 [Rhodoferax sediminis]
MKFTIQKLPFTLTLLAAMSTLAGSPALAQTSPARGALQSSDDMPLPDYLGLLGQIAPAAEEGAKAYLTAFQQRCGHALSTAELRRSMTQGDGDPVLMGLIRASHLRDAAARDQWVQRLRCPGKEAR